MRPCFPLPFTCSCCGAFFRGGGLCFCCRFRFCRCFCFCFLFCRRFFGFGARLFAGFALFVFPFFLAGEMRVIVKARRKARTRCRQEGRVFVKEGFHQRGQTF